MEFYLGKNKLDEEFSITDYCSIHEEEFHLLRDSKAIARFYKEEDSLNRIVLYLHYEIEPITKYTGNFDTLDEFLELRFGITTTQEFKDYKSSLTVMNKITE